LFSFIYLILYLFLVVLLAFVEAMTWEKVGAKVGEFNQIPTER